MLEEHVLRNYVFDVIKGTRRNNLVWERNERNDLMTTISKKSGEKVKVTLRRCIYDKGRVYELFIGGNDRINDSYKPLKKFGEYMFLDDLKF